ncbi:MAG: class I SAM-dependent methyltransferase [Myxococcota bacterium]
MSHPDWDARYRASDTPWDSGRPSPELARALAAHACGPCAALELGCGTGTNAVWLAQQGFRVTACDLSATALEVARARAAAAGVEVTFLERDLLADPDVGGPFDFVFDRGVYHVLRRVDAAAVLGTLARITHPGSRYLVITGNANDPSEAPGPPKVHAHELCAELQPWWDLVELREMVFDGVHHAGVPVEPLAWSGWFRRRSG